jgi:MFS family permease
MVKTRVEESLGANPADAALNPADTVAMGVSSTNTPGFLGSSRGRAFRALAHRPYRLLFVAFLVNQTGFWVSHLGMQGLMVNLAHNDPIWLGRLFFALFIPAFALAPIAGVVADRMDRKRIMLVSYSSVALCSAALAAMTATHWIGPPSLRAIALLFGISFSRAGPASFALAANAVPAMDMPSAVSLQSAANNLTRVVGPVVAAPILAAGRFEFAFSVYVVAAVLSAFLIGRIRVVAFEAEPEDGGILSRLGTGFRHARERRPALAALSMVGTLSFFGVSHMVVMPVFAEEVLGDVDLFAWIVVATGAGAMFGALSIGFRETRPSMRTAAFLMVAYGVALAIFSTTTTLGIALAMQFVIGWTYFAVMTSLQTLVQHVVAEAKRGRVMSLFQVAWAGLVPWGGLAIGETAGRIGVTTTLALCAGICGAYAAWVLLWPPLEAPAPEGGLV